MLPVSHKETNMRKFLFLAACLLALSCTLQAYTVLKDNLQKAKPGDYLVIAQGKNYTVFLVNKKNETTLNIQEVTIPSIKLPDDNISWRQWILNRAPGNTSWVSYVLDIPTGQMYNYYSFTNGGWYSVNQVDNFLTTLLNLKLTKINPKDRKKIGPPPEVGTPDWRPTWHPRMVVDGVTIKGVLFDGWKTKWPKDNSELSGRTIEVFVPAENQMYPSYFPYWLQVTGLVGKAKVRIIDSGTNLQSPYQAPLPSNG